MFKITFPGNKKVDASFNGFTVHTDQPIQGGGNGTAPSPFEIFLASIGTCAGIYVKGFCDSRGLDAEGIEIEQKLVFDPISRKIAKIKLEIQVPPTFPNQYHDALVNSANLCAVKKMLEEPPSFDTYTVVR
jgi:ribosomal protein S12 methylthiotransferase accessory factor